MRRSQGGSSGTRTVSTLMVAIIAALCLPAIAPAATVLKQDATTVIYTAAPGEHNDLQILSSGTGWRFREQGGLPLTAGSGCVPVNASEATCGVSNGTALSVGLGDMDDTVTGSGLSSFGTSWIFHGAGGNDHLHAASLPGGVLAGEDGDDTLVGGPRDETFIGGDGDDILDNNGGGNNDGGALNDLFQGGPGFDFVLYLATGGLKASIDGQANDGSDVSGSEKDNIGLDVEGIVGGDSSLTPDEISGSNSDNILIGGNGNDVINGNAGNDIIADTLLGYGTNNDGQNLNAFNGSLGNDTLIGGPKDDELNGSLGDDIIAGGDGNDSLLGSFDDDLLIGGGGNDFLSGGPGGLFAPGDGDTVDYSGSASKVSVSIDDAGNDGVQGESDNVSTDVEKVIGSSFDDVIIGGDGAEQLDGGPGADRVEGRAGDDTLTGAAGADLLLGDSGEDVLDGGEGNDGLDGGAGSDDLIGGGNTDLADYSLRLDPVEASIDGTRNDGQLGEQDLIGSDVEDLAGGAGADLLRGDGSANALTGGLSNDRLSGEGGPDQLSGGEGDDQLEGGSGGDVASGGPGVDIVSYESRNTGVNASLADGANDGEPGEGDDLGGDIETLIGSSQADRLVGGEGGNSLLGGDGDDQLEGLGGFDLLDGGAGNDQLGGGAATDTLEGRSGDDVLDGGEGDDQVNAGVGNDKAIGGDGNDAINGGDGNDELLAKDGFVDRVTCGSSSEANVLGADATDLLSADCTTAATVGVLFVSIASKQVKLGRDGSVSISIVCERPLSACSGAIGLASARKVSVAKRKRKKRVLKLGSASFTIGAGATKKVKVRLPKRALKTVRKLKRVTATVEASGQGITSVKRNVTVIASTKKPKKKGKNR